MAEQALVFDVSADSFAQDVLAASATRPIVVDFWAPWCGPCRMLGPILEKVVTSLQGKMALAKVNVDENQELAAQWHIRGIPAVKVFAGGKVVGEFVGAAPEPEVLRALEAALASQPAV